MSKVYCGVLLPLLLGACSSAPVQYVPASMGYGAVSTAATPIPSPLGMPAGSRCEARSSDRYNENIRSEDGQVDRWTQDRRINTQVDCKGRFTISGAPAATSPAITDYEGGS